MHQHMTHSTAGILEFNWLCSRRHDGRESDDTVARRAHRNLQETANSCKV